jgi:hypothetical protein
MFKQITTFVLYSTIFVSVSGFSETIYFHFKHQMSTRSSPDVFLCAYAEKGPHHAGDKEEVLYPGEEVTAFTTNTVFATKPSGIYQVSFECWLHRDNPSRWLKSARIGRQYTVAANSPPIHIEASCATQDGKVFVPEDIHIFVQSAKER